MPEPLRPVNQTMVPGLGTDVRLTSLTLASAADGGGLSFVSALSRVLRNEGEAVGDRGEGCAALYAVCAEAGGEDAEDGRDERGAAGEEDLVDVLRGDGGRSEEGVERGFHAV